MTRVLSIGVGIALLALAACSSSTPKTLPPPAPTSSTAIGSVPDFPIVLDDGGLHLPPGPTPAGIYRVSFVDRRTRRKPDDDVALRFQPSGPDIELDRVTAGHSDDVTLLQNLVVHPMVDDKFLNVPIQNQLDVRPTARYSTPVT